MNRNPMHAAAPDSQAFNHDCFCIGLDRDALRAALHGMAPLPGLAELLEARCPHAFAARPIFLSQLRQRQMQALVAAVEQVVAMPAFAAQALAMAAPVARHASGASGVFVGYDFHVHAGGIGLIEINTNAGGAMFNALLARAQRSCCPQVEALRALAPDPALFEERIVSMFRHEWALAGRGGALRTIAIVDAQPQSQYLYPEFLLFQQLFARHGLQAVIADPGALRWREGALWHDGQRIDLVYNRLTDFTLDDPSSAALRAAWLADAVVLTPHPGAHARYADKRNLVLLSDPARLDALGVAPAVRDVLVQGIPRTELVTADNAERLWAGRRQLFFKPAGGFGSRAAYRGDKLTRRVWGEIVAGAGAYVAQALVLPGERVVDVDAARVPLKYDVRLYVYDGAVQWQAARLYQGQTTNLRTPGGGFAPVYTLPAALAACAC